MAVGNLLFVCAHLLLVCISTSAPTAARTCIIIISSTSVVSSHGGVGADRAIGTVPKKPDMTAARVEVIEQVRVQLSHQLAVPKIDGNVGRDVSRALIGLRSVGEFESGFGRAVRRRRRTLRGGSLPAFGVILLVGCSSPVVIQVVIVATVVPLATVSIMRLRPSRDRRRRRRVGPIGGARRRPPFQAQSDRGDARPPKDLETAP